MAILSVNTPYVDGGTVTSTNLNALVTDASFISGSVDNVTTELSSGSIIVKDGGISTNKLNASLSGAIEIFGTAYVGGNKTGNTRGTRALDIQDNRLNLDQIASGFQSVALGGNNKASDQSSIAIGVSNIASNLNSSAVGYNNTASGNYSNAAGYFNTASGFNSSALGNTNTSSSNYSSAMGYGNTASGSYSSAVGNFNTSSGSYSSAFGRNNTSSAQDSVAIGINITNSVADAVEIGNWYPGGTRRNAVRLTSLGAVSFTIKNSATPPTDQSITGAEDSSQLGRDMFTIQRLGDDFTLYFNDAGTIKSLALGSVT